MKNIIFIAVFMVSNAVMSVARADKACYEVQGMTCATCGITVKAAVKKLKGIQDAKASVELKNAIVQFDPTQTNKEDIQKSIDDTGFKATARECKSGEG